MGWFKTTGSSQSASVSRYALRAAIVLGVVIAAGVLFWRVSRPQPVAVVLAQVERGRVEATVANTRAGTVNACRRARLAPASGGKVSRLKVSKGDRVRAGQVLLEVWSEDLAAQLQVAREQARSAKARVAEACVQADAAQREAARAAKLKQQGFISDQALDRANADAESRQATCKAARTAVDEAGARINAAQATVERTVLRAPFAGVVAEIAGELGEYTTPSPPGIPTPPAIDLLDDSCLYVTAPIDEIDAPAIRIGMAARITLDAFPGRHFAGRVRRIAAYVQDVAKQARTVDVEVEFTDAREAKTLLVGYSADAEILLDHHDNVLRVPTQALLEGTRVLVYRPADGILEERSLKTGLANWEQTEVLSGLSAGERIVVSLEREGVKAGAHVVAEAKGKP
jgi:HlyD family secretion protein